MEETNQGIYEENLINSINNLTYGLKHYMKRVRELESELNYYKNAYGNRVDEFINRDRFEC